MMIVFEKVFPVVSNLYANKKVRKKIQSMEGLDLPSKDASLSDLTQDELLKLYDDDLRWKEKLEDKAKTNVIGVTISVTLIMGAYTLVQNISGKFGSNWIFWLAFCLFTFSVVYMLAAGIHAIRVLTAENTVFHPLSGLKDEKKIQDLNLQIGLNRAQNTLRNNYVYTSYECIRNALVCLFVVMVIAIVPVKMKQPPTAYSRGNYYYSERAMTSLHNGVDKAKVESFINDNITDGDYSIIDTVDNLYLKYSVSNGQVIVYLVEKID